MNGPARALLSIVAIAAVSACGGPASSGDEPQPAPKAAAPKPVPEPQGMALQLMMARREGTRPAPDSPVKRRVEAEAKKLDVTNPIGTPTSPDALAQALPDSVAGFAAADAARGFSEPLMD